MRSSTVASAAALAVVAVAGAGAVVLARHDVPDPPARQASPVAVTPVTPVTPVPAVAVGRTVYFDGLDDSATTFLPLGEQPPDGRTLSAQHAFDALVKPASKLSPIPLGVRAYYGSLTDPAASPTAAGTRVWGFAVVTGCVFRGRPPLPASPTPGAPRHCRRWEFVDARTGQDLGVVEQEVLPD